MTIRNGREDFILGFPANFNGKINTKWEINNCCIHMAFNIISLYGTKELKAPRIEIKTTADLKDACINFDVENYTNLGLVKLTEKSKGFEHFAVKYSPEFVEKINGIDYFPNFVVDGYGLYIPECMGFKVEK